MIRRSDWSRWAWDVNGKLRFGVSFFAGVMLVDLFLFGRWFDLTLQLPGVRLRIDRYRIEPNGDITSW